MSPEDLAGAPEVGMQIVGGRRYASLDDLIAWFEFVAPKVDAITALGLSSVPTLLNVWNVNEVKWVKREQS